MKLSAVACHGNPVHPNKELAKKLEQKDYDQKVLQAVEKEMKVIDRFVLHYPQNRAEEMGIEIWQL